MRCPSSSMSRICCSSSPGASVLASRTFCAKAKRWGIVRMFSIISVTLSRLNALRISAEASGSGGKTPQTPHMARRKRSKVIWWSSSCISATPRRSHRSITSDTPSCKTGTIFERLVCGRKAPSTCLRWACHFSTSGCIGMAPISNGKVSGSFAGLSAAMRAASSGSPRMSTYLTSRCPMLNFTCGTTMLERCSSMYRSAVRSRQTLSSPGEMYSSRPRLSASGPEASSNGPRKPLTQAGTSFCAKAATSFSGRPWIAGIARRAGGPGGAAPAVRL
mmetsp:Transcript_85893/g.243596  ORF Transcript_85893/g.243596 Transcript_85893/m.243596 type:complete len:276 (+) Transcript_85893:699-1526(+)